MLLRVLLLVFVGYMVWRFFRQLARPPAARRVSPTRGPALSPYDVLGVSPQATSEEIRAAYQKLMREYHPDRVADLGSELRELAEKRSKEINAAYAALTKRGTP